MPFYDVYISVDARVVLTSRHRLTIEAKDEVEAARLAQAHDVSALAEKSIEALGRRHEFDNVRFEGAVSVVSRVMGADFRSESPEVRLLGADSRLVDVDGRGVSNGHIVLWTKEAASLLPKAVRSVQLPDAIRMLVARYESGERLDRHPGYFFSRYVATVRQMFCGLLGDPSGGPALVVDLVSRQCVGALMPMNVSEPGASAESAPELPDGWLEGKMPKEVAFLTSIQGALFRER